MELTDESMLKRDWQDKWYNFRAGDYIVRLTGRNCRGDPGYLCHEITLTFASGAKVLFNTLGGPILWQGGALSFDVPQPGLLQDIRFDRHGNCVGVDFCVTSIHLPISRKTCQCQLLPDDLEKRLESIVAVTKEFDQLRRSEGKPGFGEDVWWKIFGTLRGFDLEWEKMQKRKAKRGLQPVLLP